MQIIDNINHIVKNDLQESIRTGSKLSIAAACFSIYAYQELKKQLESIDELRFIFTSPTFVTEKTPKAQREFYIPRISRERSLYGTEFEVKLRNELTQKAVAKECADWIRRKAIFKSNVTQEQMMGFMTVDESTYMPINGFTTVDLGCERGNNAYYPVQKTESYENANYFLKLFEQLWNDKNRLQEVTDVVIENIIKDDRTDLDLLFGCLIDWGLPLSLPYKSEQIDGCTVHTYNDGDLIACFDANIPESVVKEIAQRKPLRAVFRDSGFASSPEKINVFEIFKLYMPEDANDISKRVRVI